MKSPLRLLLFVGIIGLSLSLRAHDSRFPGTHRFDGDFHPPQGDSTGLFPAVDFGHITHPDPQDLLHLTFTAVEKEQRYAAFLAREDSLSPLRRLVSDSLNLSRDYSNRPVSEISLAASISSSGGRIYQVPIPSAPGLHLVPAISLCYNSQAANGLAGYGWDIAGIPTISLINKNPYYHGAAKAANVFSSDPVFALDGIPIVTNDDTGNNGQFPFKTATGHILVAKQINSLGYISGFTVLYPNGQKALFTVGDNIPFNLPYYPVTRMEDLEGHYMTFQYDMGADLVNRRISRIRYGFNASGQNAGEIVFTWQDSGDSSIRYYAGKALSHTKLLQRIESKGDGQVLYQYDLTHETRDQVHLLTRIDCSTSNQSLLPLDFSYGDQPFDLPREAFLHETDRYLTLGQGNVPPESGSLVYVRGKYVRGSFNDGLLIRPGRPVYGVIMSNGTPVYGSPYPAAQEFVFAPSLTDYNDVDNSLISGTGFQTIEAVDVDGDGVDELVKVNLGGATSAGSYLILTVYKCSDTGHPVLQYTRSVLLSGSIAAGNRYSPYERIFRWGDFTASGRVQLLAISPALNSCDVFQQPLASLIDIASGDILFEYSLSYSGSTEWSPGKTLTLDLDNDSKTELCRVSLTGIEVFRASGTQFAADTVYPISHPAYFAADDRALHTTDLNADGYPDFVISPPVGSDSTVWRVCAFTGDGFAESVLNVTDKFDEGDRFLFIDINRDGLADLVKATDSKIKLWKNRDGASFDTLSLNLPPGSDQWAVVPANVINYSGMSNFIRVEGQNIREFACGSPSPELRQLTRTTDSFGRTTFNSYAFLPERSLYWTDTLTFDAPANYSSRPVPIYVLASEESFYYSSPVGKRAARFHHSFHDAVLNNQGLGFCGFAKIRIRDCADSTARITDETHDPEKRGVTTLIQQRLSSVWNEPFSEITQVYDDHSTTYGKLSPRLIRTVASDHLKGIQATTSYYYDPYDFLTTTRTDRSPALDGNVSYDLHAWTYSHSPYPNRYILGSVSEELVRRQRDDESTVSWQEKDVTTLDTLKRPVNRKHYVGEFGTRSAFQVDTAMFVINAGGPTVSPQFDPTPVEPPIPIIPPFVDTSGIIILDANYLVSETRWTYDAHGNMVSEKTAPYGTEAFTGDSLVYDGNGRYLMSKSDAIGHTTTYSGFDKFGNPSASTDYKGRTTSYTYDALGRLVHTVFPDGTVEETTLAWEGNGQYSVTRTATGAPETVAYHDALRREIKSKVKRFDGQWQSIRKEYDARGRQERVSLPYRGASPSLWKTYGYDDYDRPTRVTEASGRITTWSYSGRSTTTIKDGITSTSTTDAFGDVVKVVDAGGDIVYSLRDDGQPAFIMAPDSIFTVFSYDSYGRRERIHDPTAGIRSEHWTWHPDGSSTVVRTNPNGSVTTHTDSLGRTTLVERSGAHSTAYTYDDDGLLLSMISDNGADRVYTYDALDRVATVTDTVSSFLEQRWLRKTYTYGAGSVIASVKYTTPTGDVTTEIYTYANGHNTGITLPDGTAVWSLISENDLGSPTQILSGNVTREYGYTASGLPTYRKMGNPTNGGLGVLQHFTYQFNAQTGNLMSRSDVNHNQTESFTYDSLDRLVSVNGRTVTYDNPTGNITAIGGVGTMSYVVPYHPYRITGMTPVADSLISHGIQNVTYTSFDRPATIGEGGDSLSFSYGCDGERVREVFTKSTPSIADMRGYIGGVYEYRAFGRPVVREILYLGGDAYSAPMVYVKQGGGDWTLYNIGRDYLGSITQIATADGTLVEEYSYDPWGRLRDPETLSIYARGNEPDLFLGRGFTGHEHLKQFGLINMNARLYDPLVGRFLSPDPYVQDPGFSQNFNRYSYALNNPLKYTDESGEILPVFIVMGVGALVNILFNIENIDTLGEFFAAAGLGALTGAASMVPGGLLSTIGLGMASGLMVSAGNNLIMQHGDSGNGIFDSKQFWRASISGAISGAAFAGVGELINNGHVDKLLDKLHFLDKPGIPKGLLRNVIGNSIEGVEMGVAAGIINGLGAQYVQDGFQYGINPSIIIGNAFFGGFLGGALGGSNGIIQEEIFQQQLKNGYGPFLNSDVAYAAGEMSSQMTSYLNATSSISHWPFGHNYNTYSFLLDGSIIFETVSRRATINIDPYQQMIPSVPSYYVPKL